MGQDAGVRRKTLGQKSGGLSSNLDSVFNQVCDLGQASNLSGPQACKMKGMGFEQ